MGIKRWLSDSRRQLANYGPIQGSKTVYGTLRRGLLARASAVVWPDIGAPIFHRNWGSLIVLDACRPDALEEVSDEYAFLPDKIPSIYSNASWSNQWFKRNFTDESQVSDIAYITANAFAGEFGTDDERVSKDDFDVFVPVWDYVDHEDFGGIHPRKVTDYTVKTMRDRDTNRFIAHYMQPHAPYRKLQIHNSVKGYQNEGLWELAYSGTIPNEDVWDIYLDNLRWVLDDIELLVENVNSKNVLLTADHAELLGEYGLYGHPRKCHVPQLRRVPWVQLQTSDTNSYEPSVSNTETEQSTEEQLKALGYK